MEKLRLLPDVPVGPDATDGLRFKQYAEILARAALDTPEPFTIGVYGGWGSGKTSLMQMVKGIVDADDNAIGVWFNAWRYEKEEHLIVPLLATIITEMNEREKKLTEVVGEGFKKLRDALRGILYGVSIKGKIGIPGLSEAELSILPKDMMDRYEKLSEMATDQILDRSLYFKSFARLDEIAKDGKGPRLVIFVDDLDRCFPDKAVALLENIKLVLNQPNIAFVLGIAPNIIRAYLQAKYRKDYDIDKGLYEDYLDKLVTLPFPVPEIKQDVQDYVRGLLKREDVFGTIDENTFASEYEPLVAICGPACKDNPRSIIRFLNRLLILTRVHEQQQKGKPEKDRMRISLVHFGITNALQMKWPEVLRSCELNREVRMDENQGAKRLCDVLIEMFGKDVKDADLASDLELLERREGISAKETLRVLAADESLRALLRSAPGLEWLEDPNLRREAVATAEQVKTPDRQERSAPRREVPWADSYDSDGWPIVGKYVIKPAGSLVGANLEGAYLGEADLGGANLQKANLRGAFLRGANLERAILARAILARAILQEANLRGANLVGANLEGAYLGEANLVGANLEGANLAGANLVGANLAGANLVGANLVEANLVGAFLREAIYNSATVWSEGFDPRSAGAIEID